jgi:SRSO17 transposase
VWANDKERRSKAGVPEEIAFQTKPQIALGQIKRAQERGLPTGVVLADAGYGNDSKFREQLTGWQLPYVAGIQSTVTVWKPGEQPKPAPKGNGMGRPRKLQRRDPEHQPITVKDLARSLPEDAWKNISWRQGVKKKLASRFAALRVRPAHRDYWRAEPHSEEWLLIEWPKDESEPAKYWLSTLPESTSLTDLVHRAKHRWSIERDYEELKQELGLGQFEGRGWRGFHHHATLCIVSYGFLVSERSRFSPSARAGHAGLRAAQIPPTFRPRGSPNTPGAA